MRRYSKERGVAAVEMAFLLMPLIFIVFGITEFGRAFYQYNTIVKATRDAARFLSAQQAGTKDAEAVCLVRYGNYSACLADPSYTGPLLAPGLGTATITVCDWPRCADHNAQGTAPVVNLVSVTVSNYQFVSLVPFVTAGMATITFDNIRTTMKANL